MGFATEITLTGPRRSPAQMLQHQVVGGHASVHDADEAAALGLAGAPIEGPTHFSQFDPLAVAVWGDAWFTHGCISSHFSTMVVEGEEVQATLAVAGTRHPSPSRTATATRSHCPRSWTESPNPIRGTPSKEAVARRGDAPSSRSRW